TGYTRQAGGCLIFAKNVSLGGKTITLLGVITGATDENQRFTDAQNLLDNWPLNLLNSIVARPGNVLGQVSTGWNSGSEITASGNLSTTRWGDQTAGAKAQLSQIKIPAKSDQVVGQLTVGGKSTNLVLQSDIAAPGLWWRLTHLSQLSW
ncbi:MAG: hypothetical protein LBM73_02555, partial [Candidatus Nomurabacteria bacterium]|nr:hypothetical protein [Candidatus Nomurabacteria bacterium]